MIKTSNDRTRLKSVVLLTGLCISAGVVWLIALNIKWGSRSLTPSEQGSFTIVNAGNYTFRAENSTGNTWMLRRRKNGRLGWQAMTVIDPEEDCDVVNSVSTSSTLSTAQTGDATKGPIPAGFQLHSMLSSAGYTAIELDMLKAGYLTCKCFVDNSEVIMMIDTGAPTTHLDRKLTTANGIAWISSDKSKGSGGDDEGPDWTATVKLLRINECKFYNISVNDWDLDNINKRLELYHDPPIGGIIGADILRPKSAIIDYKSRLLYVKM